MEHDRRMPEVWVIEPIFVTNVGVVLGVLALVAGVVMLGVGSEPLRRGSGTIGLTISVLFVFQVLLIIVYLAGTSVAGP